MAAAADILWTADEAVKATGGHATSDWRARRVSIDSRTAQPGDLFVALKGPHFDGHDFIAGALKGGAAAARRASHAGESCRATRRCCWSTTP